MRVRFSKMHGLGNDFMVVDLVSQQVHLDAQLVARLGDRRTGIGFDQLLAVEPPTDPDADFFYRIYNCDGSEAEQCGNGARCFAAFVSANRLSVKRKLRLQSLGGTITTELHDDGSVTVDMGVPSVEPAEVPFNPAATTTAPESDGMAGPGQYLSADGETFHVTPVSIGNPHAVLFVPNVADADVERIGAALTRHEAFPEGANIGFCEVVDSGFIRLRVYERGVGETRACGTGACAAVVAAQLAGRCEQRTKISLPGGKARIHWGGPGQPITMTGPACLVYEGQITL
jgi:diaminopimelate epimerase